MIRVDPSHWAADFRIARALAEAFAASGLGDVVFFCAGDPKDSVDCLGPLVADETKKYYPYVLGTSGNPITRETLRVRVEELVTRWPGKFVIAIEAGSGLSEHLGSIEITDRELQMKPSGGETLRRVSDVTLSVILRVDDFEERRRVARTGSDPGMRGDPGTGNDPGTGSDPKTGGESGADESRGARDDRISGGLQAAALEVGSDGDSRPERRKSFKPLRSNEINAVRVRTLSDTVIDGNLRFLSKIGKQEL